MPMFDRVLIANRGEIACRIQRTLKRLGIASVAVYAEADRHAPYVLAADEAYCLGPSPVTESYLDAEGILVAVTATGAQAVHPGYGFLSENPGFAEACEALGVRFIGPTPQQMRQFGLKHEARALAERADVPVVQGSGLLPDVTAALEAARRIGYPVMIKSTAGGGGIGLQRCRDDGQMAELFDRVVRLSRNNFQEAGVFVEKYIERGRHIEVQIFGDGQGGIVVLGERDCSAQRRNQKVIEETPAPGLSARLRDDLHAAARRLGESVTYANAGTVEFIVDADTEAFYFLEVNTRLQVEHCVTEAVTGVDLVEWMLRQAAGLPLPTVAPPPHGAAIEARLYAEDPAHDFRPSTGLLTRVRFAEGCRVDTWVEDGTLITPFYDPLLAKIIVHGADRAAALARLRSVLNETVVAGIETNLDFLRSLAASPGFAAGGVTTRFLDGFAYRPATIDVLSPGTQSTIQDYPGRIGSWAVGVPPSGPMDSLSFRLANRAVGNPASAAALEIMLTGPTLRFRTESVICLAGAPVAADLDGRPVALWEPIAVAAGATLRIASLATTGCRVYLAVRGGFDVPPYLGSRSTFMLGKFGGHGGRALQAGDVLHLGPPSIAERPPQRIPEAVRPSIGSPWDIGVLEGPHGAPDFFTAADIETFFAATWEVHYNFNRTGIRLLGPKPTWARTDGGDAGLHPSNIHDNAYAIGAIDFTGDMPVILGPDGPSLGGFVCPATIVQAELWKLGQLRAGDRVRFHRWTVERATTAIDEQDRRVRDLSGPSVRVEPEERGRSPIIIGQWGETALRPEVVYRRAGDQAVLIEYGPPVLDIALRLRAHVMMTWLAERSLDGILDVTPGIRSLQVHYDSRKLPLPRLIAVLREGEDALPPVDDIEVPTRIVHLPLCWDDEATQLAIAKYMQSVRADAPWCPSNIEFIRRINGLDSVDEVRRIVFAASYLVMGLGDVYLGAPVATPLDPRHRLVTTKYNPARTWTPENAVGIGGAYLCIYGMEGPGGYQFVGRTCQMWNTYKKTAPFDRPWLLRFFDQIRFYPVSGEELRAFREDFPHGRVTLDIRDQTFRFKDHRRYLARHADDIAQWKARQQRAFAAERARWEASGQIGTAADVPQAEDDRGDESLPAGCVAVTSPVAGSVWRVAVAVGQTVEAGATLLVIESMKMEIPVQAATRAVIIDVRCTEKRAVAVAQTVLVVRPEEEVSR